jgi:AcrR family transcriptional regulator
MSSPSRETPRTRRPRRSSAEVRRLLLEAARELFATNGFGGATTKEIARRADVNEAVLFRNFPTKERLFEAAVLQPFEEFLAGYTATWLDAPAPGGGPEDVMRQYTEQLYSIVRENRALFAALATSRAAGEQLQDALGRLERVGDRVAQMYGLSYDTPVAVRAAFTMIVGMAIFEEDLFPRRNAVSRQRIVEELTQILTGAPRRADGGRGRSKG